MTAYSIDPRRNRTVRLRCENCFLEDFSGKCVVTKENMKSNCDSLVAPTDCPVKEVEE